MKVLVSGSTGLIGSALLPALRAHDHEVVSLVRRRPGSGEVGWDPADGVLDPADLAGIDSVVHLAGEGIGNKRWSAAQKQKILDSRLSSTDLLARRLAEVAPGPSVLISGSAIGFYGDRGDELLDEDSEAGTGFLADVCSRWEAATAPAEAAGIRVAHIRTGVVLSPAGGALKKFLPLFKLFVGGKLGSGRQYQSWITLDDEVAAIVHTLETDSLAGPVNLTAPHPVTNAEFTRALGAALGRPTILPVPGFGLSLLLGKEFAAEMVLGGQRVLPKKLEASGFAFSYPEIEPALRAAVRH
ncbi:MAG: TIGR01777 family oxidoreductase [Actinomycetota bacterium]|nr:TIGR01777 family oxidoreductase [Actinomycetota bacterium]